MKTAKRFVILLTAFLTTNSIFAFYSPEKGVWLTRDPINDPGKQVLHTVQTTTLTNKVSLFSLSQPALARNAIHELGSKPQMKEESNPYEFVGNNSVCLIDAFGNCICMFKGHDGMLTVDVSCKGVLSIWVIDEHSAPASGAVAGTTVLADGFVMGGITYKIDGSTCVTISCSGGTVNVTSCVNCIAAMMGKKDPYPVTIGAFGGSPKEPTPGSPPPVAK